MRYLVITLTMFFAGCATQYPCQEPGGISCKPVSEIYALKYTAKNNKKAKALVETNAVYAGYPSKIKASDPVRTYNRTVRVWLAPWVDNRDIFHDQSFLYMVIHSGHWRIEDSHREIINKYKASMPKILKPITSMQSQAEKVK
jgi:hypothetical protein